MYGRTGAFVAFFGILLLFLGWRRDGRTGRHTRPRRTPQDPIPSLWCRQGSPKRVTRRTPADPRTTILKWRPWPAGRLRVTTKSHHRPTQPATVSPGCLWRAGMARRPRDEPVRGSPRPPRVDFGHSCTALSGGADMTVSIFCIIGIPTCRKFLELETSTFFFFGCLRIRASHSSHHGGY